MNSDHRERLIRDLLASGSTCLICHREVGAEVRAFCTRMFASRGPRADPCQLCQNYLRGGLVCNGTSREHGMPCAIEAANRGLIDFDYAIRALAEGRASDEECSIITFPHMNDSDFFNSVVSSEAITRIYILARQMRPKAREVADALEVVGQLLDPMDARETMEFPNPFDAKSQGRLAEIFNKCLNVFAVREDTSASDESTWTLFARAILTQFARQLRCAPSDLPPIVFPLQIAHAKKSLLDADSRQIVLRIVGAPQCECLT